MIILLVCTFHSNYGIKLISILGIRWCCANGIPILVRCDSYMRLQKALNNMHPIQLDINVFVRFSISIKPTKVAFWVYKMVQGCYRNTEMLPLRRQHVRR